MVKPEFSLPDPQKPLQILDVYDGLTIDADCWQREREYQQQRQNLHYRSLNQPGIVCGLGVRLMAPDRVNQFPIDDSYKDGRWVEVQPGIAIDVAGNPIVVNQPISYRIHNPTDRSGQNQIEVYLYASYRKPNAVQNERTGEILRNSNRLLSESFAIAQQTQGLEEGQIELCRISLDLRESQLRPPQQVFAPQENELNFLYRRQATWRSNRRVKAGLLVGPDVRSIHDLDPADRQTRANLAYLMKAVEPLYPRMQGVEEIDLVQVTRSQSQLEFAIGLEGEREYLGVDALGDRYNFLYLGNAREHQYLKQEEVQLLRSYLQAGGMLLIEVRDLSAATIDNLKRLNSSQFGEDVGSQTSPDLILERPFLFPSLPQLKPDRPGIEFRQFGNILVIIGELSSAWGRENDLPRSQIRTAHELGINLLDYACHHWEQHRCYQWKNP